MLSLGFGFAVICAIEMNSATWVLILFWKVIEVVWLNRLEFLLSQVFYSMKGIKVELCVCGFWRLNKVYMWYELFHEKMIYVFYFCWTELAKVTLEYMFFE